MKKNEVEIGATYRARLHGNFVDVRIESESTNFSGRTGWNATNMKTGRSVYIKSAAKLRRKVADAPGNPQRASEQDHE